ncbi:MAG: hypothetical protein AB7O67_15640 [Vicinamibacterales bacterium]
MIDSTMNERFAALGYRLILAEDEDGVWVASARRLDTGDPFGPPMPADRGEEAAALLAGWLEWQRAHANALAALQAAEGAYNRHVAEAALGTTTDEAGRASQREALSRLDACRSQLDQVREQRPWPH